MTSPPLHGIDFTSAPSRRKPITVASGRLERGVVTLEGLQELPSFDAFELWVRRPGPWLGAFDFPFGLPHAFVDSLRLGGTAEAVAREVHRRCASRMDFRALIDDWGRGRPPGSRLVHRATDTAMPGTRSSSPLQTRYVPVGFMYFEGFGRLLEAGLDLPGLRDGDPQRVAVEAYPGLLAHRLVGRRSYKNTAHADRLVTRKDIVHGLEMGAWDGLRLRAADALREKLVADASGDLLDAALCLVQAAWASTRPRRGLPPDVDPVEGWIVSAEWPSD